MKKKIIVTALSFIMLASSSFSNFQPAQAVKAEPVIERYAARSTIDGSNEDDLREEIVSYAKQFVGNPYVYGGTSLTRGTDCSGFTMSVYRNFGVNLNRISRDQANNGKTISVKDVQKGDLLFYTSGGRINHVAMYIGGGKIVHASNPRTGICISNMNYRTPYKAVTLF